MDQKAKTLIIEHPLRTGYTLLNQKPMEKTAANYRFEVALAAGATKTFAVSEEYINDRAFVITDVTPDLLMTYIRNRDLSEDGPQAAWADRQSEAADRRQQRRHRRRPDAR